MLAFPSTSDEPVHLPHDGVQHETDKAKLFLIDGEKVWLPKSQIVDEGADWVAIPRWLAEERELDPGA